MDPDEKELRREVVNLHQRFGKVIEESPNDETRGAGTKKRCRDTGIHKNGPAKKSHLGTRLTRQYDV
jgi:hypothetical protein